MTPFVKKKDIKKDWYIIDAQNAAVGRVASFISKVLRGKNKSTFNPHIDNGDFVVVTNIDKIKFSGKKFKEITEAYQYLKNLLIQVEFTMKFLYPIKQKKILMIIRIYLKRLYLKMKLKKFL